jgi:hypothetical protein
MASQELFPGGDRQIRRKHMNRADYLTIKNAAKCHLLEQACVACTEERLPDSEVLFEKALRKEQEILLVSQDPFGPVVDFYDSSRGFCLTAKAMSGTVLVLANN